MKNLLTVLFLAASSLTVFASEPEKNETAAATITVDFKGTIADVENYSPISEAEIMVISAGSDVQKKIKTDAKGGFAFTDLPAGTYTVKIARNGYESYTRNSVVIEDGKMLNLGFSLFRN